MTGPEEEVEATNINELSDKEFRFIFRLLPLRNLISTELTCKKWHSHSRQVCSEVADLTLYVPANRRDKIWTDVRALWYSTGRTFHPNYKFADSSLPIHDYLLNKREAQNLKIKFPKIRSLELFGLVFSFDSFSRLIQKWPDIESLAFICDDFADGPTYSSHSVWNNVWKLLDSLAKLKHLALPHGIRLDRFYSSSTIRRLNSLQIPLGIDTNCKQLVAFFQAISSNSHLQKLTITNILKEIDTDLDDHEGFFDLTEKLSKVPEETFTQLTHLGWHFLKGYKAGVDEQLLTFICDRFTSLTHLDLNVSLRFKEMIPQLNKLSNLTSLRITVIDYLDDLAENRIVYDSDYEKSDTERFEPSISTNPTKSEYKADYDRQYKGNLKMYFFFGLTPRFYKDDLVQLSNIKELHLVTVTINRWEAFDYLKYVFPNIEMLNLEKCELVLKRMNNKRFAPRRKLLLEKFRVFSKLKRIYRNNVLALEMSQVTNAQVEKTLINGKMKDFFKMPKVVKNAD